MLLALKSDSETDWARQLRELNRLEKCTRKDTRFALLLALLLVRGSHPNPFNESFTSIAREICLLTASLNRFNSILTTAAAIELIATDSSRQSQLPIESLPSNKQKEENGFFPSACS